MSNEFRGTGTVGTIDAPKTARVGDEESMVTQLRVYFDAPRQDGAAPARGFWLDVNVWGERRAPEVALHLKKGARVHVVGRLAEHRWTVSATGEERRALYLDAHQVFLSLARVAEVRFQPRRENAGGAA